MSNNASLKKRFVRNNKGTVAVVTALSLIPILAAVGVAIDFSRYTLDRTAMQAALDSGSLSAVTQNLKGKHREEAAEAFFDRNIAQTGLKESKISRSFKISNNAIEGNASKKLPTTFMGLLGIKTMDVVVSNRISIPPTLAAEIALVVDYSGSMGSYLNGNPKYQTMRDAAKMLVKDISEANPKHVKFALIPFSDQVYTTLPGEYVIGGSKGTSWSGCTYDRQYPYNLSDSTPLDSSSDTKWGQPPEPGSSVSCDDYIKNSLILQPLTDDFKAVTNQLDSMMYFNNTHIAVGAEFGFHVLSDNAPFTEAASFNNKTVKKYMVLLTDGEQTTAAFGPNNVRGVQDGEKNLETLCTNIKASGITIFTIAFDLNDQDTVNRLRQCATEPSKNFFNANDTQGLTQAFEEIKKEITAKVFISG